MPLSGLESFFLDKLIEYLRLMNKDFAALPDSIMVKEKTDLGEFDIHIYPTEKWIRIQVTLDKLDDIPEDKRYELLRRLLLAAWDYPEISFGVDQEGKILAIQDQYVHAFYFDSFEEEYAAIIASIDIYHKIKSEVLGLEAKQKAEAKKEEKN